MNNLRKLGLVLLFWCMAQATTIAQTLKEATTEFDKMSYVTAAELFEKALQGKLVDSVKTETQLKLVYCYRQMRNPEKVEKLCQALIDAKADVSAEPKFYLYFAQALASNSKYKEAQQAFDQYNAVLAKASTKPKNIVKKRYDDPVAFQKNAQCYQVEPLPINTNKAEFSPMYYQKGLVFASSRIEKKGVERVFAWDNSNFLDLFFIKDLKQLSIITPAAKVGGTAGNKPETSKITIGSDEYTPQTPNDTKTIGSYNMVYKGYASGASPTPTTDSLSKNFGMPINSKYHEGAATFTNDFKTILFTRNNYAKNQLKTSQDRVVKLKIYTAQDPQANGHWQNVQELSINDDEYSVGHPALSRDNKWLYFVSDKPGGFGGTDIYMVAYNNGKLGKPMNLGAAINTEGNEMFPFIDEDGNLYFASDGHLGLGGLDVFYVELTEGNKVMSKARNLGAPINSAKDDFGLITDANRKEGFFSSNRKNGGNDDDLYRFTRTCEEQPNCNELQVIVFDAVSKLPLDNADVEVSANGKAERKKTDSNGTFKICLADNQTYLLKASREGYNPNAIGYSAKDQLNNSTTIDIPLQPQDDWSNDSVTNTLPCKITTLRGRVTSNNDKTPMAGVTVTLKNDCDNSIQQVVTKEDGKYQFDICEGCDYTLDAAKNNYASKGSKIAKVDKTAPKFIHANVSLFEKGEVVAIDNIYYDYGRSQIRRDAALELDKLVALMKNYPAMKIEIRSHTDCRSSAEFNQQLSENRSKAVVTYLQKRGIESSRMQSMGLGEKELLNECADGVECTEEQHQINRRTEFKVIQLK